jgi:hypothetical protein
VAVSRCDVDVFPFFVMHLLYEKLHVTFGGHDFDAVADRETIFDVNLGPAFVTPTAALSGEFAGKLLSVADGETIVVILLRLMHVTTKKTLGVAAMGEAF